MEKTFFFAMFFFYLQIIQVKSSMSIDASAMNLAQMQRRRSKITNDSYHLIRYLNKYVCVEEEERKKQQKLSMTFDLFLNFLPVLSLPFVIYYYVIFVCCFFQDGASFRERKKFD